MTGKFLVGRDGTPIKRYTPKTPPVDLKDDIEQLLVHNRLSEQAVP